jgi:hypothetical protein
VAARCARAEANADDRVFAQLVAGGFGTASGGSRKLRPSRSTDQAIHVEFPSRGITAHLVERRPPVATLGAADAVILVNLDASGVPMEISTSYAERGNLSIRMACRRFARLTNAFSKKLENHAAAVALYVAHYNFCRVHKTLETTPAIRQVLPQTIENLPSPRRKCSRFTICSYGRLGTVSYLGFRDIIPRALEGCPHECTGCRLVVFSLLALAALDRGGCLLHRILCPPFRLSKFLRAHFARD